MNQQDPRKDTKTLILVALITSSSVAIGFNNLRWFSGIILEQGEPVVEQINHR
ncbi:MAG: hypothetical protein SAJ37_04885 [Oscillatoria sp. PMC 1068.18]|nr:hypothetical protein [Oscillatoria sp. PMC 1076.18]MEC4988064.1 hypothetical protein [Oscillatoria sp. PMC 1068.18]